MALGIFPLSFNSAGSRTSPISVIKRGCTDDIFIFRGVCQWFNLCEINLRRKYIFEGVDFDVIKGSCAVQANTRTDGGDNAD